MSIKRMRWGIRKGDLLLADHRNIQPEPESNKTNKWKEILNKPISDISWDELKEGLGKEMAERAYLFAKNVIQ